MSLLFFLFLYLHGVESSNGQLCDPTVHSQNIKNYLETEIGDKYTIITGNLMWLHNMTKWAENPSGIYGVYVFPYSTGLTTYDTNPDLIFHCHDAILFSGCTPPQSHYYSVVNYLFNRYESNKTIEWLFASLGASLNHLVINITGINPFNNLVNIIHTGDNNTFSDVYHALHNLNQTNINLATIPHKYFNFAPYDIDNKNYILYKQTFDSFLPFWRITLPINITQYNKYA
eukprot:208965_1